jgi:hypothetical protein
MGKLNVLIVGTVAAILQKAEDSDKYPSSVRFLLPKAAQQLSKLDDRFTIEATQPFIGVPQAAIVNPLDAEPLFVAKRLLPVMNDAGEWMAPVEMAFFEIDTQSVLGLDFESETRFETIDGNVGDKPTKETAPYLSWAADMTVYAEDHAAVDERYMDDDNVPDDVAVVNFDRGSLSVARVGFDHRFDFINSLTAPGFNRAIADALKLSAELTRPEISVRLNDEITIELDATRLDTPDISLLMGSEPLYHFSVAERERPCGVPFFQHEILYQLSERPDKLSETPLDDKEDKVVIPVCVNVEGGDKDPDLGRCIPPTFMTAPKKVAAIEPVAAAQGAARALSLHLGVNTFSATFTSTTSMPAPAKLDSCVRDAVAMQKFADSLGFRSLKNDGKNVFVDSRATVRSLTNALKDYGQALGAGGLFLLTFSGHGAPVQLGGGGWCLNTNIILYSRLKALLAQNFSAGSRIMVISDCCHAGQISVPTKGVKEIPYHYAAEFFRETFVSRASFEEEAPSVQSPTIYFVFACGENETINDGGKNDLSPFTKCVQAHPHDATVKLFEKNLRDCSKKHSHIDRLPAPDPAWEAGEPFSLPAAPRHPQAMLAEDAGRKTGETHSRR